MKERLLTTTEITILVAALVFAAGGRITLASRGAAPAAASPPAAAKPMLALTAGRSELPTEATAAFFLNRTPRHGELHRVPLGSLLLHSYVVYPDRAQRAPVLLIEASNQGLTDWLRAVADQAAQEGFIAVVPDVLS